MARSTAWSIASSLCFWVASAAAVMISSGVAPNEIGSSSVSRFMVSVPVLSLHSTSTPASSDMAESLDKIAFCFESFSAPRAMVTDMTAGMATGMDAINRTRTNWAILPAASRLQVWVTRMSL